MSLVKTPNLQPISYRPDIDGLRAIAVLSVVLHHLNADILPGGFVGVDVFFVISGFLITSQIYQEICQRSFSLSQFYKRRINRIVPALFIVIAATILAGFVLLSPADLVLLAKSAVASMFGFSNVFFWREYGNYFSGNSAEAPLLHSWSLGVEEQFYFIWPLLLAFLVSWFHRRILRVVVVLLLAAVAVSEAGTVIAMSASYYLLPTRFFELLMGGSLALISARYFPKTQMLAGVMFVTGMALILGSLAWIDKASSFPGITALCPCLGGALLIWSGQNLCPLHRALTNRPIVFVGLVSYSLYLWHWPLIAFLNYLDVQIDLVTGFSVIAGAIILAWLSWRFVETPFRQRGGGLPGGKVVVQHLLIPGGILITAYLAIASNAGLPNRFDKEVPRLEASLEFRPNVLRKGCHVPTALYDTPPSENCRIGAQKTTIDGFLIGDSFANHFTGMLDVIATDKGVTLMDYTMDACPPLLGYDNGKVAEYSQRCIKRNQRAFAEITNRKFARVILAANWPTEKDITADLSRSIEVILSSGAGLTIIHSNVSIPKANSCPIRAIMYDRPKECSIQRSGIPPYFATIKARYPEIIFLDPNEVICRESRCHPLIDNVLLYRDAAHLNDIGSRHIGRRLLEEGVIL